MLDAVKKALRITHSALDGEIKSVISAALLDMSRVGIVTDKVDIADESSYDELILQCVTLYSKWNFDYLGKAEQWLKAYENLRNAMSLCGYYNGGDEK
ncbi:MAG: hypothetical protein UH824_00040 [Acutalibacteraceae bacterium]|nr:hypothetical protein [Acutalibacteraceae bacterium]